MQGEALRRLGQGAPDFVEGLFAATAFCLRFGVAFLAAFLVAFAEVLRLGFLPAAILDVPEKKFKKGLHRVRPEHCRVVVP